MKYVPSGLVEIVHLYLQRGAGVQTAAEISTAIGGQPTLQLADRAPGRCPGVGPRWTPAGRDICPG
jgi:hypothetical protein